MYLHFFSKQTGRYKKDRWPGAICRRAIRHDIETNSKEQRDAIDDKGAYPCYRRVVEHAEQTVFP